MEGGKKRLDGYFSEDRISALPDSLVDCILDCLSLHDVVRTSVLSTRWRHCWTRVRKLVFDLDFFEKYIETGNSAVGSVIESILSRLDGPIHEFCLDVVLDMTRKVSQPVMDTSHALRLDVSRWIPLLLEDEDVDDDYADDDKLYVIHAPQLESLLIYSARRTFYLIKCPSLTLADLCTKLEVPMVDRLQTTKLDSFVLGMPKVETLVLRGAALTSLAVGGVPTTLTTRFQNLKDLDLYYIDVLSTAQLSSAFCIIRSSPNLQSLKIFMTDEPYADRDENAAIRFYNAQEDDLSRLSKVEFNKLLGTKYEVMFMETVLCCCPVIESVTFRSRENIKLDSEIRMMTKSWEDWLPESANIYFEAQWQEETKNLFDD